MSKLDFLNSCFHYYQQCIFLKKSNIRCAMSKMHLSPSFLKIKTTPLLILDYPNIIHILYEKYQNQEEVAKHFYHFLFKNQSKKQIVILSKQVMIEKQSFNIDLLLNLGASLNHTFLSKNKNGELKNIFIYQLDYERHISSSMDDLIGYFICFVSLFYYRKSVLSNQKIYKNHIQYITNDKQYFNKNLFGKTEEERRNQPAVKVEKITTMDHHYFFVEDPKNEKWIRHFLNEYMIFKTEDTKDLECNIEIAMNLFSKSFLKQQTERKSTVRQKIRQFIKTRKNRNQKNTNTCDLSRLKNEKKFASYYLYAMIKTTQKYLKNDFYGSFSKEDIIRMIF